MSQNVSDNFINCSIISEIEYLNKLSTGTCSYVKINFSKCHVLDVSCIFKQSIHVYTFQEKV